MMEGPDRPSGVPASPPIPVLPNRAPRARRLAAAGAGLLAAGLLVTPAAAPAFSLLGFSISLSQRDFRIFNNFLDATANDNVTPHPNFPSALGATMSMWKSAIEWGSGPHGNGTGDGTQTVLGSGGANLDFMFQGSVGFAGVAGDNIISATGPGCGSACGGVTEFAPGGGTNGWRIRVNDSQLAWDDAPGFIAPNLYDIQSTSCHEFGHALGLGHTSISGSTMVGGPVAGSVTRRSIEADDIAGVQAIYGIVAAAKPRITGFTGSPVVGMTISIAGMNFAAAGNEVWFTNLAANSLPVVVPSLPSTGGGTQIDVVLPANAARGHVAVRTPGSAGSNLSNVWPIDVGAVPPVLTSISPNPVPFYSSPSPTMTLTGTGLGAVSIVDLGGVMLTGAQITVSPTQITFTLPDLPSIGSLPVTATSPSGGTSAPVTLDVGPTDPPVLLAPSITATGLTFTATTYGTPGDLVFLAFSASNVPSVLPGIVSLSLGNAFAELFLFPAQTADPLQGATTTSLVVPPGLAGNVVYFQGAALPPALPLPLPTTNLASTLIFF